MWPFQVPGVWAASPPVEVHNEAQAQVVAILWPGLRATMSEIARRDFHCGLQIEDFAVGWGAEQLGALVDTACGLYVERGRSQSLARCNCASSALVCDRMVRAARRKAEAEADLVWARRLRDMTPASRAVAVGPRKRLRGKSRHMEGGFCIE